MPTARRLLLAAVALLLAVGLPLGAASWVAQAPLPGDVAATCGLQSLFGSDASWAAWLTDTAKPPLVLLTVLLGAGLAWAKTGWRGAITVPAAFLLVWMMGLGLRAGIFVPKPTGEFVEVFSESDKSGLPSTFALLYGAAFGATVCLPRVTRCRWAEAPRGVAVAAVVVAVALLTAGMFCRVILGGHWLSQMLASLATAFGVTLLIGWVIWAWRPPVEDADLGSTNPPPTDPAARPRPA